MIFPYPAQVRRVLQASFLGSVTFQKTATSLGRLPLTVRRALPIVRGLMNAKTALIVTLAGLVVGQTRIAATPPGPARTTGKVLILDNERAIEGDIALQGEQYCVRRGMGEITFPAAKALRLCADWDE